MVCQIKQNLKTTQDRMKNYADKKRTAKDKVGEHVFLRVKLKKRKLRSGLYAKLAPRYVGPFKLLARIVPITYQLALPPYIIIHAQFIMFFIFLY